MSKYKGSKPNTFYDLVDEPWKTGGEGSIYKLKGNDTCIAKIFKPERRTDLQQKKLKMMAKASMEASIETQTTWPKDLLYENGKPIGYIMKMVHDGELLCEINGPDNTTIDWNCKLMIAANLCSAVDSIHNIGHVIGDMNPRNILINRENLSVTLIDTDSYHIIDDVTHEEYRCGVGMSEYLAPELLKRMSNGTRLDTLPLPTFTKETDRFALAVHIFALLMDGFHPFTCRILDTSSDSVPCPQKKDNIINGFSPYFIKNKNLGIPKTSPTLSRLPAELQTLFRQAFVDGYAHPNKRPTAKDWDLALRKLHGATVKKHSVKKTKEDKMFSKNPTNNLDNEVYHEGTTKKPKKGCLVASILLFLLLGVVGVSVLKIYNNVQNMKKQEEQFIEHIQNNEFSEAGSLYEENYGDTTLSATATNTMKEKITSIKTQFQEGALSYEMAIQHLKELTKLTSDSTLHTEIENAKTYIQALYSATNLWNNAQTKVDNEEYIEAIQLYSQIPTDSTYYENVTEQQVAALDLYAQNQLTEVDKAVKEKDWEEAIDILTTAQAELDTLTSPEATIEVYQKQFSQLISTYETKQIQEEIDSILEKVNGYIAENNYESAITLLKKNNAKYKDHKEFSKTYEDCLENYKEQSLVSIKKYILANDYINAKKLVTKALSLIGDDKTLLAVQEELENSEIVFLKDMKIVDSTEVSFPESDIIDTIGVTHSVSDSLILFGAHDDSSYGGYMYGAFADYYIGENYTTFSTKLIVPDNFCRNGTITVQILLDYGDFPTFGTINYELADIKRQTLNQQITLDVTGVKWLRIWVSQSDNPSGQYHIVFSGAQLQKASSFSSLDDVMIED